MGSENFPMKKSDGKFDIDAECKFSDPRSAELLETVCKYEYMRESQALRDAINGKDSRRRPVFSPFVHDSMRPGGIYRLVLALQKAGFPKPWNKLKQNARRELVSAISEWDKEGKKRNPPVVIEAASPEPDEELNYDPDKPHDRTYWRLAPSEPELLRGWEQSERKYFFGFIRIDEAYNETEAAKAFKTWFGKRREKTKGGGRDNWRAKLKNLVVMRIWKRERDQWKRLKQVAEFCGCKSCVKEAAAYKERCKQGRGDDPMSNAAKVEISSARGHAREFFQGYFPGEEPLNY
jgi:hypothetical protein